MGERPVDAGVFCLEWVCSRFGDERVFVAKRRDSRFLASLGMTARNAKTKDNSRNKAKQRQSLGDGLADDAADGFGDDAVDDVAGYFAGFFAEGLVFRLGGEA